jgi:acyl-coenzyme A thioesterase PaaI-like protein
MTLALAAQFTSPVTGGELVAEAEMVARGRTTFFTRVVVRDGSGRIVATGQGTHRFRSGSERPEGEPVRAGEE